jgi:hypothetical protein
MALAREAGEGGTRERREREGEGVLKRIATTERLAVCRYSPRRDCFTGGM